jgi:hypothetical protein
MGRWKQKWGGHLVACDDCVEGLVVASFHTKTSLRKLNVLWSIRLLLMDSSVPWDIGHATGAWLMKNWPSTGLLGVVCNDGVIDVMEFGPQMVSISSRSFSKIILTWFYISTVRTIRNGLLVLLDVLVTNTLFLVLSSMKPRRKKSGRLSPWVINKILAQIVGYRGVLFECVS